MTTAEADSPPPDRDGPYSPRRVGVTGHRPDRLQAADIPVLQTRIRTVLDTLRDGGERDGGGGGENAPVPRRPLPRRLVIVSSLAEGADRLVATEALRRGDALRVILPFGREEFARDFATAASWAEYARLLDRADTVTELAGGRETAAIERAAYAAAGQAVLDGSDVLLAVWDGEEGRGIGGTEHVVQLAVAREIPVIWVAARPPHGVRVVTNGPARPMTEGGVDQLAARAWVMGDG